MKKISIEYQGKDYEVKLPTIEMWSRLIAWKDLLEERDFLIKLISESTGLPDKDIKNADWFDIVNIGSFLTEHLLNQTTDFHNEFEFRGIKYRFIDLPNLTFGEFIDIDTILSKDEHERKSSLHTLMALFYREVGEDNKLVPYDSAKVAERAELFKKLPVMYVHGSMSFFLRLEQILQRPSRSFLVILRIWKLKKMVKNIEKQMKKTLANIGVGLASLRAWLMKIFRFSGKSPNTL